MCVRKRILEHRLAQQRLFYFILFFFPATSWVSAVTWRPAKSWKSRPGPCQKNSLVRAFGRCCAKDTALAEQMFLVQAWYAWKRCQSTKIVVFSRVDGADGKERRLFQASSFFVFVFFSVIVKDSSWLWVACCIQILKMYLASLLGLISLRDKTLTYKRTTCVFRTIRGIQKVWNGQHHAPTNE